VNDNAKMHFQRGKTYKIRIVNMSALASKSSLPTTPAREMTDASQCSTSHWTNMISM
jgi:hypothetical protein